MRACDFTKLPKLFETFFNVNSKFRILIALSFATVTLFHLYRFTTWHQPNPVLPDLTAWQLLMSIVLSDSSSASRYTPLFASGIDSTWRALSNLAALSSPSLCSNSTVQPCTVLYSIPSFSSRSEVSR